MDSAASRSSESAVDVVVTCRGLTKDYGGGNGLFDLNLDVLRGEVFGFVGPNGSGKSTTIRLLMNLISADAGSATIFGQDTCRHSTQLKRHLGYLPGELPHFPGMRAGQVVTLLARLRGGVPQSNIDELAERFALDLSRKYSELSHGNKQKVSIIQAFMHDPELLILDEPTLGLDPLMQREFIDLVRERSLTGTTVVLSSHVLSEVQVACDRIGLIRAGRLIRTGTLNELRSIRKHRVVAVLADESDVPLLDTLPGVSDVRHEANRWQFTVTGEMGAAVGLLARAGLEEIDSAELSLEEVFLAEYAGGLD